MTTAYVIEVRAGPLFGEEVIRSIEISSLGLPENDAADMIESYRDYYANRNEVVWDGEEVNAEGVLRGLGEGLSYEIRITPPLPVEVSPPTQPTLW